MMGADFDGVMSRLLTEQRVAKFVLRFPADPSFGSLLESFAAGDIDTAFRAAHTLKGTSANLGFTDLYQKASDVTEDLRHGNPGPDIGEKVEKCKAAYESTCAFINKYAAEKED